MKKPYTLKFICRNCYHEWKEKIPFGSDINSHLIFDYMFYNDEQGKRCTVHCPRCGSQSVFKTM